MKTFRITCLLLLVLGTSIGLRVSTVHAENRPPNILVILVDDLGFADLSSYGSNDLRTPHIDTLISRGMRFDNFYANCPVCSPTRASLLTGRYPELVGVPGVIRTHAQNNWGYLSPDAITMPELLARAGYDTAMVGKWHLGLSYENSPNQRGFDYFQGFLGDMMDDYYSHLRHGFNYMRKNDQEIFPQGHATDLFSQWASDYLRSRKGVSAPFFLYLAYNAPHTPIQPPEQWLTKVKQREPNISNRRAKLVALIEHLDAGVGRVLKTLEDAQLVDDTVVIFTSDNGGQLSVGANNGPWRAGKGTMYEGGLRVPACIVWPGHIRPHLRTKHIAATMDIYPTVMEIAGVSDSITRAIDGQSFLPIAFGENRPTDKRDLFFHRREGGNAFGGLSSRALQRDNWKLVQNSPFSSWELYNLSKDAQEQTDLSQERKEVFNKLAGAMRRHIQRGGAVPWQVPQRRDAK